jgi:hypothetical protein
MLVKPALSKTIAAHARLDGWRPVQYMFCEIAASQLYSCPFAASLGKNC